MKGLQLLRYGAGERREEARGDDAKPGFGRHGNKQPLVGADADNRDKDEMAGRCRKKAGRSAALLATLMLAASGPGCYASGPIEQYTAPDNHGSDIESDSESDTDGQFTDAGLITCAGEIDADKEEFLPDGDNARLTKAGHMMWIKTLDQENGSVNVKITDMIWNQIGDEITFSEDMPSVELDLDGETFNLIFCGIVETEEGFAAQFRITRPNGFVHCDEVKCGNESNPLEHMVDLLSTETIITFTHSEGEYPDNDYAGDCADVIRTIKKQSLSFAAPLFTQNNLGPDEDKTVVVHDLDSDTLEEVEMELLEVDGEEGSAKIGISLASGDISEGETLTAGDLEVEVEAVGDDDLPEFSYAWPADPYAPIWENSGDNANEKEVNVQADSGYYPFVIRYTGLQENGSFHIHVFKKQDVQVLENGEQANIGSQIYTGEITIGDNHNIVAIELDAVE